jgi:CheY-like chemotaxis protein
MNNSAIDITNAAKGLARNPLGIIALFIVMVYGFASLVTAFASSFVHEERQLLVYFLVVFPVLVLITFAWLFTKHSVKLFAPGDFKNEENYFRTQISAAASLAIASAKSSKLADEIDIEHIIEIVRNIAPQKSLPANDWKNHILWVDDNPDNNIYERQAFEAFGFKFSLALSTQAALTLLDRKKFAAVISDMGRKEGPREGYVLLDTMREQGDRTPLFFYASSNAPEHKKETQKHGGQGCTNNAQELFRMITKAVISGN